MAADHIVDHLHDEDRISYTRAPEEVRFRSAFQGAGNVDGLDAGLIDSRNGGLAMERYWRSMDGAVSQLPEIFSAASFVGEVSEQPPF
jgi:hypothetical protein